MNVFSTALTEAKVELDAGIKAVVGLILVVVCCLCNDCCDVLCLGAYLLLITILLRNGLRFILRNLATYGVFILVPYSLGLLLSLIISKLTPGLSVITEAGHTLPVLKFIRIFYIWYIGNLYFFTTPFEEIASMLNKALVPLNRWGIPVARPLNMVLCIVNELITAVVQFKGDVYEKGQRLFNNEQIGPKAKLRGLAEILAEFIAVSLLQINYVETALSRVSLNPYKLTIMKNEILAMTSLLVIMLVIFI